MHEQRPPDATHIKKLLEAMTFYTKSKEIAHCGRGGSQMFFTYHHQFFMQSFEKQKILQIK